MAIVVGGLVFTIIFIWSRRSRETVGEGMFMAGLIAMIAFGAVTYYETASQSRREHSATEATTESVTAPTVPSIDTPST